MLRRILCLALAALALISSPIHSIQASEQGESSSQPSTADQDEEAIALASLADFLDLSALDQAQHLISYLYQERLAQRPVELEDLTDYLPEGQSTTQDQVTTNRYVLKDVDQTVDLTLVVDEESQEVLEAMATSQLVSDEEAMVTLDDFESAGDVLRDNYANKTHSYKEEVADLMGAPYMVSLLQDLTIYRYRGEEASHEVALTERDGTILSLNYLKTDKEDRQDPLALDKRTLDRMTHEAGVTWQQMINKLGQPMGINYDSDNGMIALSWYSEDPESVQEVYYYMAYDGVSIGIAYQ